jgi:GT2 family glycosyltransferase
MCSRTIKSLEGQDFASWDSVIAKNGGDSYMDAYRRALRKYLVLPNVHMLVLPNRGLGYALNKAAQQYLGSYDAFAVLEDDDEWDANFLKVMYRELMNSGADVAHCLQRQVPHQKQSPGGPMNEAAIQQRNWVNFPMCLFRASLFERAGGFSEEAGPATDWDWHLRILKAGGKYHFVDQVLVTHHWHTNNYCIKVDGKTSIQKQRQRGVYE